MKVYAVRRGRNPGIYDSWTECQQQIYKYSGAVFKSFENREDAETYLREVPEEPINRDLPYAYIDGSYSNTKRCYSGGGFICNAGEIHILQRTGNEPLFMPERNIAGEVMAALITMDKARRLHIPEIVIYYDYAGIANWLDGSWKALKPVAQDYKHFAAKQMQYVTVHFVKVEGHTGIYGNEIADLLAKEAAGVKLRKKDVAVLSAFKEEARSNPGNIAAKSREPTPGAAEDPSLQETQETREEHNS